MPLELKLNADDGTLDLHGTLPAIGKRKAKNLLSYNSVRGCYQGAISEQVLGLAIELHARIESAAAKAVRCSESDEEMPTGDEPGGPGTAPPERGDSPRWLVKHSGQGIGRLVSLEGGIAVVEFFFPPSTMQLRADVVHRVRLPVGTACETEDGLCTIRCCTPGGDGELNEYRVEFENGLQLRVMEDVLTPIELRKPDCPLELLATLQHGPYYQCKSREKLVRAYTQLVARGAGVKSILSSRIDLHGHQAYVAGTVILDSKQRYLLADEVGLGKTIEAGIVIHDLLSRKAAAKVLVLCPSSLVEQWFSEMYSKFSGVVFRLPELSGLTPMVEGQANQVIVSFRTAAAHQAAITSVEWELVVIDEVHHLLNVPQLYGLARTLSGTGPGLLLLSALPAQHRAQEYYDLLALLEPDRYVQDDEEARQRFETLLERQREIGGRIGVVRRRLEDMRAGEPGQEARVIKQLKSLQELPVLRDDEQLSAALDALSRDDERFGDAVETLIHRVSDYYRINRRILRNRRERLIAAEQLQRIRRDVERVGYDPDQYELDALHGIEALLRDLGNSKLSYDILVPLVTVLNQACCDPSALVLVLRMASAARQLRTEGKSLERLFDLAAYSEVREQLERLFGAAKTHLNMGLVGAALEAAEAWRAAGLESHGRFQALIGLLRTKHQRRTHEKFVLFCGFPGLAKRLSDQLSERLGRRALARFHYGMDSDPATERDLKEQELRRFRKDCETWLLVCDETGGEGRNFQFAAELVHFDLPFQASKVEQRIGRLDRLGREREDVISNVLICEGSHEATWFRCLDSGLGIFERSISGLEFSLRQIESDVTNFFASDDTAEAEDLTARIQEKVVSERALDEAQAQMDEASYERKRAGRYRRAQSTAEVDRKLESAFSAFFASISDKGGVRFKRDPMFPEGIIEFHPDDTRDLRLKLSKPTETRTGTFRRPIAQARPDLEFFGFGNDFFDAVCSALWRESSGRSYAVECVNEDLVWRGFEFSYRLVPGTRPQSLSSACGNRLEYFLAERTEHCFVSEDGEVQADPGQFIRLRRSLKVRTRDRAWCDLSGEHADVLERFYPDWDERVRAAESAAKRRATERFAEVLDDKLGEQKALIGEQVRTLSIAKPDGWRNEVDALLAFEAQIADWSVALDCAGFMSVNGGIVNG